MTKFSTPENNKKAMFPVFPVPIYINRLTDDREFNQALVRKVETLRNSDPEGVEICKKEYRTGYTSFFSRNQIQKDAEFAEIAEQILRHGRCYARSMGFSTESPQLNLTTMFGTINVKGKHAFDQWPVSDRDPRRHTIPVHSKELVGLEYRVVSPTTWRASLVNRADYANAIRRGRTARRLVFDGGTRGVETASRRIAQRFGEV